MVGFFLSVQFNSRFRSSSFFFIDIKLNRKNPKPNPTICACYSATPRTHSNQVRSDPLGSSRPVMWFVHRMILQKSLRLNAVHMSAAALNLLVSTNFAAELVLWRCLHPGLTQLSTGETVGP